MQFRSIAGVMTLILFTILPFDSAPGEPFAKPKPGMSNAPLLIHFNVTEYALSNTAKQVIRDHFKGIQLTRNEKILVIGYTDDTGAESFNDMLSWKRAASVKKEITSVSKIKPKLIVAKGYGIKAPIDSNTSYHGRALNRRVEIYTRGVEAGFLQDLAWIRDHNRPHIRRLIETAQSMLFERNFDQAMLKLKEAEKLGGKRLSDWHLTCGVLGYFRGMRPESLKSIFEFSLDLDPYNTRARDYLGRIQARETFKSGRVGPEMGRDPSNPIQVDSHYQEYEYIRLFKAIPVSRFEDPYSSMDTVKCETEKGETVIYYFRRSNARDWAY